jgi:hypothetical protein
MRTNRSQNLPHETFFINDYDFSKLYHNYSANSPTNKKFGEAPSL